MRTATTCRASNHGTNKKPRAAQPGAFLFFESAPNPGGPTIQCAPVARLDHHGNTSRGRRPARHDPGQRGRCCGEFGRTQSSHHRSREYPAMLCPRHHRAAPSGEYCCNGGWYRPSGFLRAKPGLHGATGSSAPHGAPCRDGRNSNAPMPQPARASPRISGVCQVPAWHNDNPRSVKRKATRTTKSPGLRSPGLFACLDLTA